MTTGASLRDDGSFPSGTIQPNSRTIPSTLDVTPDWAVNKLPFEKLGIYGRQREMEQLETAVCRLGGAASSKYSIGGASEMVNVDSPQKQLLLISGYSGTGKSSLVSAVLHPGNKRIGGAVTVTGKFDQCLGGNQRKQQRPFTAFGMICEELAQQIFTLKTKRTSKSKDDFEVLKDKIMVELGTELIDLIQVFPSLDVIISVTNDNYGQNNDGDFSDSVDFGRHGKAPGKQRSNFGNVSAESRHRFIFAFRLLIRIISSILSPLVLVLDDLQWADTASLDLLEGLLSDRENKKLVVVGIYRSNEVDEAHLLSKTLRHVRNTADEDSVEITEIEIGNLDIEAVNQMLRSLLSSRGDETRVRQLAETCRKKTAGNAFYLIHFLTMLCDEQLLVYNVDLVEWQWNAADIEMATKATENVVDILKRAMKDMPLNNQQLLQFAAYLGSAFDEQAIDVLWRDFCHSSHHNRDHNDGDNASIPNADTGTTTNSNTKSDNKKESKAKDNDMTRKQLEIGLQACQKAGLLEKNGQRKYRWVHDKLQEAAMDLVPSGDRALFSRHVAEMLNTHLNEREVEEAIFVIVDRFNEGTLPQDPQKRLEMARLNLRAANKAVIFSAFENASTYCGYGIKLLPDDCWETQYQLSLDLYSLGAETEGFLGNVTSMDEYCNEVLRQEERTTNGILQGGLRDKFRVYNAMLDRKQGQSVVGGAADLCLDVLRKYGTKFPKHKADIMLRTVYNIGKIKSTVKHRTSEEIENLSLVDDAVRIEQMALVDKLVTVSKEELEDWSSVFLQFSPVHCLTLLDWQYLYYSGSPLMPLAVFKSLNWTLKYGLSKYSPPAFAFVSVLLAGVLFDLSGGSVYARYALTMLNKLDSSSSRAIEARTIYITHAGALHWSQPIRSMLKPLLRGYAVGMQAGETENGLSCVFFYILMNWVCGKDLATIEEDCRIYTKQMKDFKKYLIVDNSKIIWQLVLNLMGRSQFKTELSGEAMVEEECREKGQKDKYLLGMLEVHKTVAFSYFGEYEQGAELALRVGDHFQKLSPGSALIPLELFHQCLCMLVTAQRLQRDRNDATSSASAAAQSNDDSRLGLGRGFESKCIQTAKRGLAKIKSWTEKGNPNISHYEPLLDAELAAYQGRPFLAKKYYEMAVIMAGQRGFLQDCALCNERFGDFMLNWKDATTRPPAQQKKMDAANLAEATFRLQEAIELYREWGAHAKADCLETQHASTLTASLPNNRVVNVAVDNT